MYNECDSLTSKHKISVDGFEMLLKSINQWSLIQGYYSIKLINKINIC